MAALLESFFRSSISKLLFYVILFLSWFLWWCWWGWWSSILDVPTLASELVVDTMWTTYLLSSLDYWGKFVGNALSVSENAECVLASASFVIPFVGVKLFTLFFYWLWLSLSFLANAFYKFNLLCVMFAPLLLILNKLLVFSAVNYVYASTHNWAIN